MANSSLQPIGRGSARGLQVNRLFPASFAKRSMRMFQAKHIAGVLIAICLASTGETAPRLEPPDAAKKVTVQPRGRAYLFRGFIGLTDWGMDELTDRINRAGVTADVSSYLMWRGVADQAISDYRRDPEPITIIGHSLGGDAAVKFAERLDAASIPVSLLVTYDPTRFADNLSPNVERYINLYQSSNILVGGGGDVAQGRGFHGHYASFDLKDLHGIYHTNMEKFGNIHDQLVSKITALAATPASAEGEAIPLRIDIPSTGSIELWDSGLRVSAHAGGTLQNLAATYHVPLWALSQVNNLSEGAALTKGERFTVPRYLNLDGCAQSGLSALREQMLICGSTRQCLLSGLDGESKMSADDQA